MFERRRSGRWLPGESPAPAARSRFEYTARATTEALFVHDERVFKNVRVVQLVLTLGLSPSSELFIQRLVVVDSSGQVLLVDGDTVLATPDQLSGVSVAARVVGEAKGPKIVGYNYKPKSNQRRRWGHRQRYSTVEITGITRG